jgi:hypothetical protein
MNVFLPSRLSQRLRLNLGGRGLFFSSRPSLLFFSISSFVCGLVPRISSS